MRSLLVLAGLSGLAVLATTITAHAQLRAPAAGMSVKVESSTAGCGQLFTGHIMLGSTDGKNAVGYLELAVQGHTTRVPFEVGATPQKFAVTSSRPLSCKDGLGTPTFTVFRDGKQVDSPKVKPKTFKADQQTAASQAPGKPWIKHMALQGTCGSPGASGFVELFSMAPMPVQVMVGVDFAGSAKPVGPLTLLPNQVAQVAVPPVSTGINCEQTGIPPLKYTLPTATAPAPNAGSLEATEIVFEP